MDNQISHEGIIESIDGEHIVVRIVQMAACSSCQLAGKCQTSESKVKFVDVWDKAYRRYNVGQNVTVVATNKVGALAVIIGFVIPVVVVMTAILITLGITSASGPWPVAEPTNQAVAALVGLLMLVPYYFGVWLSRKSLQAKLTFTLA